MPAGASSSEACPARVDEVSVAGNFLMTRRAILTPQVLAGIPALVAQGLRKADIAERLGCKESTLQVRCSNAGISLRGRRRLGLRAGDQLTLSHEAMAAVCARAAASGCTEAQL